MLVEDIELTLSHVDLGWLDEYALLCLFANAHSHRITRGTGHSIRGITDVAGQPLYCGYLWTHLRVPSNRLLRFAQAWDSVEIGVDVSRYGTMLLSSTYVAGTPGEIDRTSSDAWNLDALPSMRASNTFYTDRADSQAAVPRRGSLAELPVLATAPEAIERFRRERSEPMLATMIVPNLDRGSSQYVLANGRDLRPGHGIMFGRYVQIADAIERAFLRTVSPASAAVADCWWVLERETFYFANTRAESSLTGRVTANLRPWQSTDGVADAALVAVGVLDAVIEIYDDANVRLTACRVKKLLGVPRDETALIEQAREMANHRAG